MMMLGSCARGASPALALLIAGLTLPVLPARADGTLGASGLTGPAGTTGSQGPNGTD